MYPDEEGSFSSGPVTTSCQHAVASPFLRAERTSFTGRKRLLVGPYAAGPRSVAARQSRTTQDETHKTGGYARSTRQMVPLEPGIATAFRPPQVQRLGHRPGVSGKERHPNRLVCGSAHVVGLRSCPHPRAEPRGRPRAAVWHRVQVPPKAMVAERGGVFRRRLWPTLPWKRAPPRSHSGFEGARGVVSVLPIGQRKTAVRR